MNCCEKCFTDIELKAIVHGGDKIGKCDFCGATRVHICDIEDETSGITDSLKNSFENLLDVYTPVSELGDSFPCNNQELIKSILVHRWKIFNITEDKVYTFLTKLLRERYAQQPDLFNTPVDISERYDEDYLKHYGILGTHNWEEFATEIKTRNRFHSEIMNKSIFSEILKYAILTYPKNNRGKLFYRARICAEPKPLPKKEMKAPPIKLASAGRVNPEGISCLYLTEKIETAILEVRASIYDYVSVGEFKLKNNIEVVDLTKMNSISPFCGLDTTLHAINLSCLRQISEEIAKPMRRHDSKLDYLPTQYICEYIKSLGYAGVKYRSTMDSNSFNLAIFDENLFEFKKSEVYEIKSLVPKFECIET